MINPDATHQTVFPCAQLRTKVRHLGKTLGTINFRDSGGMRQKVLIGSLVLGLLVPVQAHADHIKNPIAVFAALDKVTARIQPLEVKIDETITFGALKITPRVCYTRPSTEMPVTSAFIEVDEIQLNKTEKRIFTGWMFAQNPGLHAVEHPVFDVWLTGCKGATEGKPRVGTSGGGSSGNSGGGNSNAGAGGSSNDSGTGNAANNSGASRNGGGNSGTSRNTGGSSNSAGRSNSGGAGGISNGNGGNSGGSSSNRGGNSRGGGYDDQNSQDGGGGWQPDGPSDEPLDGPSDEPAGNAR